ncbi:MAG: glycoside hydrolase family 5 protein [Pseudonocardiaceae bacterium]
MTRASIAGAVVLIAALMAALVAFADGGRFRVDGNRIVAPDGERFVMKGVVAPYGTFAGGDAAGLGRRNEQSAPEDFERIAELGANTVKVYVTPNTMQDEAGRSRLAEVVEAARDQDLVVVLTGFYADFEETLPWVRRAAEEYAGDPYVWILPMNEPGCTVPEPGAACTDYEGWQREHRRYVDAIRGAGMESPIIVNTPGYSWDLTGVRDHPLGDPDVVLGAHRYANDATGLTAEGRSQIEHGWARLGSRRPVVLDEVGNYNGDEFGNSIDWTREMIDYARGWVERGEGSGVVAFNWRWSDPNTLTSPEDGELTEWGRIFVERFLEPTGG